MGTTLARLGVALVGVALLGAGAVAVFVTDNSAGSSALVAAGVVLVAVAMFTHRIESFEGGGVKVQLRAVAAKLREAEHAEAGGDDETAERLRREAQQLLTATHPIAARYEDVRKNSTHGRDRTTAMRDLVAQARTMAGLGFVTPEAVGELLRSGQDGNRIVALGLMQEAPKLVSVPFVTDVIRRPRSHFEQWQALRIGLDLARRGDAPEHAAALREAVAAARAAGSLGSRAARDQSRIRLAAQVEAALESTSAQVRRVE